jgi:hypothetical protein
MDDGKNVPECTETEQAQLPWLADGTTLDEIQDELFRKGASGELVDNWKEAEELDFCRNKEATKLCEKTVVDMRTRKMVLQIMHDFTVLRGLGWRHWCGAVEAFDIFCLRAREDTFEVDFTENWVEELDTKMQKTYDDQGRPLDFCCYDQNGNTVQLIENEHEALQVHGPIPGQTDFPLRVVAFHRALGKSQLLTTCVAIVRLLEKSDRSQRSRPPLSLSINVLFSGLLKRLNGVMPEADLEAHEEVDTMVLMQREFDAMKVLDMRLTRRPTFDDWLSILRTRFDVLSRGKLGPAIEWASNYSINTARLILWAKRISEDFTSQRMAIGLFALGLTYGGVLPLSAFKPHELSEELWMRLNEYGRQHRDEVVCYVPTDYWNGLLEILTVSARSTIEDVRAHVICVLNVIANCSQL